MIKVSKRILILCEDKKSSLLYLDSFKKDEKLKRDLSSVSIEIYQPSNFSPLGLVNEAKRRKKMAKRERNAFDEIWVVLDKDGHANLIDAINIAEANRVEVALSIICFEYWVLLHFERTTKAFTRSDEVIKYIKKNHFAEYEKCSNCYPLLKDKTLEAIANAKWAEIQLLQSMKKGDRYYSLDAYTNIHKLVEKLFNPKENLFV